MKTYLFKVVVEPDGEAWTAYAPALVTQGASTWGKTQEEALQNLEEVIRMVVESLVEHGEPIPENPRDQVQISAEPQIAVTVSSHHPADTFPPKTLTTMIETQAGWTEEDLQRLGLL